MTRKLILFDVDGTLLDHEKKIPDSTKQAIADLQKCGHEIVIATGRGPYMLKEVCEALQIESYVCFNGSYVIYKEEVLYKHAIDTQLLEQLTKLTLSNQHPLVYMTPEGMRTSSELNAYAEEGTNTLTSKLPPIDKDYYIGREIYQCLLFCKSEDEHCYKDQLSQLGYIRWHPYGSDVLPPGGSKARGIQALIERTGFKAEDVYAFGDGINDIEMLQYVHHSVAMGNAPDVVKQAARYVTKDVQEDGILYGLKMVGLL